MNKDQPTLKPCPFCGEMENMKPWTTRFNMDTGMQTDWMCGCKCGIQTHNLYQTKEDAIEAWNTRAPSARWVSVDERLPDIHEVVLTYAEGRIEPDYCTTAGKFTSEYPVCDYAPITHWMPLPQPPADTGGSEHE